jgi:hypothetical protein
MKVKPLPYQGQQIVDDARSDDHAGHASVSQPEILEDLDRHHHRGRRHRDAQEQGGDQRQPERQRDAGGDREGHDGAHDGHAHGRLQRGEELTRIRLDTGVQHEEEDAQLRQDLDHFVGLDPAEDGGSEHDAHDQLAHDGRQPDSAQQHRDGPDDRHEDEQLKEDGFGRHMGSGRPS